MLSEMAKRPDLYEAAARKIQALQVQAPGAAPKTSQKPPPERTGEGANEQIEREPFPTARAWAKPETQVQAPQLRQPKIFLCYRREDTQGFARGIYRV